jgi:hypothetical protein
VEFESIESIRRIKDLRINVSAGNYFAQKFHDAFPDAEIIPIGSQREFFEKKSADALLTSAEGSTAWTLLYPAYSVVVPIPSNVQLLSLRRVEKWNRIRRVPRSLGSCEKIRMERWNGCETTGF